MVIQKADHHEQGHLLNFNVNFNVHLNVNVSGRNRRAESASYFTNRTA
jgi:hypothetical protein